MDAGRFQRLLTWGLVFPWFSVSMGARLAAQENHGRIPDRGVESYLADFEFGRVQLDVDAATGTPLDIFPETRTGLFPPIATEAEAEARAAEFVDAYPQLFHVSSLDLSFFPAYSSLEGRVWGINSSQVHAGLRIRGSYLHVVLTREGELAWVTARLFPAGDLAGVRLAPALSSERAAEIAEGAQEGGAAFGEAQLEVAFRSGSPVLAWNIRVVDQRIAPPASPEWVYVIAADTGEVLEKGSLFAHANLVGDVKARGTPPQSLLPDVSYNPPAVQPFALKNLTVKVVTPGYTGNDETDPAGNFVIPGMPTGVSLSVQARAITPLFEVFPETGFGPAVEDTETGTTSTFLALRLNETPTEFATSQINAFVWTGKARDYSDYLYTSAGLTVPRRTHDAFVNSPNHHCNGTYLPKSMQYPDNRIFYGKSGSDCVNMAYSTVVGHEFGHHFTRELQTVNSENLEWGTTALAQLEGCADVYSTYLTGQSLLGQDYKGQGTVARDVAPNVVFPNGGCCHDVGLALAGSFWDLRQILEETYGVGFGKVVAEFFFAKYVDEQFRDMQEIPELDERAGEIVAQVDAVNHGGFYKSHIVNSFLPHNLYRLKFIRGDANGSGSVTAADGFTITNYLTYGTPVPTCLDACDAQNEAPPAEPVVSGSPPQGGRTLGKPRWGYSLEV